MRSNAIQLLDELAHKVQTCSDAAIKFRDMETEALNFRTAPDSWSILECLEHLNRYGDFYLPEIEQSILQATPSAQAKEFKSSILGNYFANMMKVKDGKVNRMKTFKDKNPIHSDLSPVTIDRFLKQQEKLLALLTQARKVDLTKTTTGMSLTKFLRFRLGDTFRFFIFHIERHIWQAQNVAAALKNNGG